MITERPNRNAELYDLYRAHLRRRLTESAVPECLHAGLVEYIAARRPTGGFLRAVLSNDLTQACIRADYVNRIRLFEVVRFLQNFAPGLCWGSEALVAAWLADPSPAPVVIE